MNILVFGANSAIAQEVTKLLVAQQNTNLYLVARNQEKLVRNIQDLKVRFINCNVGYTCADLTDIDKHDVIFAEALRFLKTIDLIFVAHGDLGNQTESEKNFKEALKILNVNYISQISIIQRSGHILGKQRNGTLAVITSIAGDRGKPSNYTYCSAKAGVSTYLQGLRAKLFKENVTVLDLKLGFVDTPMTAQFKKGLLWSRSEEVAIQIVKSINNKKDIVYIPCFWRFIMLVIIHIPERIFKRLKL